MDPQISERNEGTLREIAAVAHIEGERETLSRDVCPAVEDNEFEAESRLEKIRGAKGRKDTARDAMAIVIRSQVKKDTRGVRITTGNTIV